jgi:hypothetical protein
MTFLDEFSSTFRERKRRKNDMIRKLKNKKGNKNKNA